MTFIMSTSNEQEIRISKPRDATIKTVHNSLTPNNHPERTLQTDSKLLILPHSSAQLRSPSDHKQNDNSIDTANETSPEAYPHQTTRTQPSLPTIYPRTPTPSARLNYIYIQLPPSSSPKRNGKIRIRKNAGRARARRAPAAAR